MKHDNRTIVSACHGKHAFPSWSAAAKAVKRKATRQRASGEDIAPLGVYRCPHCQRFHIGGQA